MDTSIIILTRNAGANFPSLLEKIFKQNYTGSFEVIVIDSGSTDTTLNIVSGYPLRLIQIKPEEFHHGRTRNLGAELAQGNILVYITQDALPLDERWLQNLTSSLKDNDIGMVCGRQIPWPDVKPCENFFYHYYFPDFKVIAKKDSQDYYHDNMFISNVNSAIRKELWKSLKFSETVLLGEDKEFASRVLKAGYSIIYEPLAIVYHAHDLSIRAAFARSIDAGIALKQGVADLPRSKISFMGRAFNYILSELRFLAGRKQLIWFPYCLAYEIVKFKGVMFGKSGLFAVKSTKIKKQN